MPEREKFSVAEKADKLQGLEQESEPRLTRREFLEAAAAAGSVFFLTTEAGAENEPGVDTLPDTFLLRSKYKKISYTGERKTITPELRLLITDIAKYDDETLDAIGISNDTRSNQKREVKTTEDAEHLEARSRLLWERLTTYIPDLGPYSREHFSNFMAYDLPRRLAPYGIFAKPILVPVMDTTADRFVSAEVILSFFNVDRVESEPVERWGKNFTRDVVYLGEALTFDGQPVQSHVFANTGGQTFYLNSFIYRSASEEEYAVTLEGARRFEEIFGKYSPREAEIVLERSTEPEKVAATMAKLKIYRSRAFAAMTPEDVTRNIIEHETRHIIDHQDGSAYRESFPIGVSSVPTEFMKTKENGSIHEEINGLLSEMRYGQKKEIVLLTILDAAITEFGQDVGHDRAIDVVMRSVVANIANAPERYGVSFDAKSKLSKECQALLALPELVERPEVLETLAQSLLEAHEKAYAADYRSAQEQSTSGTIKQPQSRNTILVGGVAGAAAALIGVGGVALRKLAARKERVAAESILQTTLSGDDAKLVEDLQLGSGQSRLNERKRELAFRKLIRIASDNPVVFEALSHFESIMNDQAKRRYEKLRLSQQRKSEPV